MATFTIDLLKGDVYLFSGDFKGSGGTSPVSGATYPEVNNFNELPTPASAYNGKTYLVRNSSDAYILNRKESGLYISLDGAWRRLGDIPSFFKSDNFQVFDAVDNTKGVNFNTGGISTNTFKTLTIQNSSGTIAYLTDLNTKVDTSLFNFFTGTTAPNTFLKLDQTNPQIVSGGTPQFDSIQINLSGATSNEIGKLQWNQDDETLEFGMNNSGVTMQIGQETVIKVINNSGNDFFNGQIVYPVGALNGLPVIELADAAASPEQIGMLTQDLPDGETGFVTVLGKINHLDTSSYTIGTPLYLGITPGSYTDTPLEAPYYNIPIGVVLIQDAEEGVIIFDYKPSYKLEDLANVVRSGTTTPGTFPVWNGGYFNFETNINDYLLKQTFANYTGGTNLQTITEVGATTDVESTFSSGLITNTIKAYEDGVSAIQLSKEDGTPVINIDTVSGFTGFGITEPDARLHIQEGTTSIAPIKLTSGSLLTTPQVGAIEFNGIQYFGTTGSTRHTFAFLESPQFTGTPNLPIGSTLNDINLNDYILNSGGTNNPLLTKKSDFDAFTGTTLPANYVQTTLFNTYTGNTQTALNLKANLASPAFTGTPTAPTAAVNTNSTQIATTAYVVGQAANVNPLMNGTVAIGTSLRYARQDHVHASDTSRLAVAGGIITGSLIVNTNLNVNGITALNTLTIGTGLAKYNANYGGSYDNRTLVDKEYVDTLPLTVLSATSAGAATTTSTTDTLQTGMQITGVPAGTYLVGYGNWLNHNTNNGSITTTIYIGGTAQTGSEMQWLRGGGQGNISTTHNYSNYIITLATTQTVEIRWRTNTGTATSTNRYLTLLKVSSIR